MPDDFPEDHELLAFFGVEPKLLDPSVPSWFYNTLEFRVEREAMVVECTLCPHDGDIDVRLLLSGVELTRLSLRSIKRVKLYKNSQGEALIANFYGNHAEETFGLMLWPRVWMGLGTFRSIPPRR